MARGVCKVDEQDMLTDIHERTRIEKQSDEAPLTQRTMAGTWISLPDDAVVSMNMWGFTRSMMEELKDRFPKALEKV